MVKTTSNKRALIRFLKVFSLPLVLLFLVFEMLESGKGGLHYSIIIIIIIIIVRAAAAVAVTTKLQVGEEKWEF